MRAFLAGVAAVLALSVSAQGATIEVIGRSQAGRPIVAFRAGDPTGPPVLIVGCIHGNECAGRAITTALRTAPLHADLWIVPTLNPDGTVHLTRQNSRGVDLNRNWPVGWRRVGRPWSTYYSGRTPYSERETRVGRDLILRVRPRLTIWYHQHMNVVWAFGPSEAAGTAYALAAGMRLYPRVAPHGAATGWQHRLAPADPAFVVELPAGRLAPAAVQRHVGAIAALVTTLGPRAAG